jgi:DNA-binding transcriptional LysR family regulator
MELALTVNAGLNRFAAALRAQGFGPAMSERTFTLAMSDYAATILLPTIVSAFERTNEVE